jgi:hypothetical protein
MELEPFYLMMEQLIESIRNRDLPQAKPDRPTQGVLTRTWMT